jgi:hypothetical protein
VTEVFWWDFPTDAPAQTDLDGAKAIFTVEISHYCGGYYFN